MATLAHMGKKRRKAPGRVRKDEVVRMRVTSEQKVAMVEAASKEGLELSQWLRRLALKAAGVLPPT